MNVLDKHLVNCRVIGRYKITYKNGMFQEKNLIKHSDYENIIKLYQDEIYDLQKEKKERDIYGLKQDLKIMFGKE